MKVGFWIWISMFLIGRRTKIWVRITTGKDFHLSSLFWKRESKTTKDSGLEHRVYSGKRSKEFGLLEIWTVLNLKPGPQ